MTKNTSGVARPLIALATDRELTAGRRFGEACTRLTQEDLVQAYQTEMENAPQRASVGKSYFVETHEGIPSTGADTKRHEEHFALAIFNQHRPPNAGLQLPDGEELHILDYQLPLKAKRSDTGVGKVDLFGVTASGQATLIELKAAGGGDSPLRAALEGLAYAAIIQANLTTIRKEAQQRYSLTINMDVPRLIVMAPEEYWLGFRARLVPRGWQDQLLAVADRILQGTGVAVGFVALRNCPFVHGLAGTRPVLDGDLVCLPALQGCAAALHIPSP
jgi:hypothetical protein